MTAEHNFEGHPGQQQEAQIDKLSEKQTGMR